MSLCLTCNGWGVVIRIHTPPPSQKARREVILKHLSTTQLKTQLCPKCLGYGHAPEDTK